MDVMRTVMLYHFNQPQTGAIDEYIREFEHRFPAQSFEKADVDGREGAEMASLYDITIYPAILVLDGDGSFLQAWQGEPLPLMDEVASYSKAL